MATRGRSLSSSAGSSTGGQHPASGRGGGAGRYESKTFYELCGLTPVRTGLLNLFFIGIPFRFGLLPTGILVQTWLHEILRVMGHLDEKLGISAPTTPSQETTSNKMYSYELSSLELFPTQPCSIFHSDMVPSSSSCRNNTELLSVYEMGQAFLFQYGLAWVVLLIIRIRPQRQWVSAVLDYHRLLLTCTLVSVLLLAFFQKTHPHVLKSPPFDSLMPILQVPSEIWSTRFFSGFVFYNLMALSFSLWTLLTRTPHSERLRRKMQKKRQQQQSPNKQNPRIRNMNTPRRNGKVGATTIAPPPRQDIYRTTSAEVEAEAETVVHPNLTSSGSPVNSSINTQKQQLELEEMAFRNERKRREEEELLEKEDDDFMKWSIPANALFFGAVVDGYRAIAQGQALWQGQVHHHYHVPDHEITSRVLFAFGVKAFYTLAHAIWLLRIRSFLSLPQMRYICFYQAIVRHGMSILWMYQQRQKQLLQENSPIHDYGNEQGTSRIYHVWTELEWIIYLALFCTYMLGFLWAGQATGISKILASGSEDDHRHKRRRKVD